MLWHSVRYCVIMLICFTCEAILYEGDPCVLSTGPGVCIHQDHCDQLHKAFIEGHISNSDIPRCGYTTEKEIICCPVTTHDRHDPHDSHDSHDRHDPQDPHDSHDRHDQSDPHDPHNRHDSYDPHNQHDSHDPHDRHDPQDSHNRHDPHLSSSTVITRGARRPAAEVCHEIELGLQPPKHSHNVDGKPLELGLYPHMAAIGYFRIKDNIERFDYKCSGTLIAKRFVLSAAHCTIDTGIPTTHVLLGAVDLDDFKNGKIIDIKQTHSHPNYIVGSLYNDVAVIELESDVQYTTNIYPICLSTEKTDLPKDAELIVTGWDRRAIFRRSDLLKTKLHLVELDKCQGEMKIMASSSRLDLGVHDTQLCAKDVEPEKCAGDTGGPLIYVEDQNSLNYRLVGINAAGYSCGYAPGLYTRVTPFLDFIEHVVWPNYI